MITVKFCFSWLLIFFFLFILRIGQVSKREQEYEKERKKNYIVILLTLKIVKSQ